MHSTFLCVIFVASTFFISCNKEENSSSTQQGQSEQTIAMLCFDNSDDLCDYLNNVESNNKKKNFVSFGEIADEAYYAIHPEEMFCNIDEVVQYVLNNRYIFQLILCDDGEYMIETRMYNHPFRHIANQDGIFRVCDTLYKIIENGYAYTSLDNESLLKGLIDNGYRQNTAEIKFYTFGEEVYDQQDSRFPHACTQEELYNENTNGNNRITLQISNYKMGPINNNQYRHGYRYFAKPYHKSIGWWGCNRTITANVNYMEIGSAGIFNITDAILDPVINLVYQGSSFEFCEYSPNYNYADSYYIVSCTCTANTPDAGTVIVECN